MFEFGGVVKLLGTKTERKDFSQRIARRLFERRRIVVMAVHAFLWCASFLCAFLLRFDGHIPTKYSGSIISWMILLMVFRVAFGWLFNAYEGMWRYAGAPELFALTKTTLCASLVLLLYVYFSGYNSFPRSIFIVETLLALVFVGGLRILVRQSFELFRVVNANSEKVKRLLIVGAGDTGVSLAREVQKSQRAQYHIVGFLDDDERKSQGRVHGVPILGGTDAIETMAKRHAIDELVVAIPSASPKLIRAFVQRGLKSGVQTKMIPGLASLMDGRMTVNQIRDVAIQDLLGRDPVQLDERVLSTMLKDKVVLVTGAGGSIGSELCRQVLRFAPEALLCLEQAENALFDIDRELKALQSPAVVNGATRILPLVADVCDRKRLEEIFREFRPSVVIHAAAHKHVPMMELNPGEAIKNNILGTSNVATLSSAYGAERFVMVSTDKAVNPTSVMGCTKRVAEKVVRSCQENSSTCYVSVRFGNVLGSNGSVIPLFKEQIAKGGPVTVTHPEMTRYFMTIPEASQLVLQAGAIGEGGEIFILDMGEPVRILDLAESLIRLSGFKPYDDIDIEFVGMRPGEKIYEELSTEHEQAEKTKHPKIFIGRAGQDRGKEFLSAIQDFGTGVDELSSSEIREMLQKLVPSFSPIWQASHTISSLPTLPVNSSDEAT